MNEVYRRYMASPEWQAKRQEAFAFYGRKCMSCGETRRLEVHHDTYWKFGHEDVIDLSVLCVDCHATADRKRRAREKERKEYPLMEKWAAEKFGPRWFETECDPCDMMDRYHSAQIQAINDFFAKPIGNEREWFALHAMFGSHD